MHPIGILCHGFFQAYVLTDPDVRKSGSTTCEIVSWTLTLLVKKHNVDLTTSHVHLQLDNASGENKNNTVFQFAAYLALRGLCASTSVGFLQSGHTHEDIDMEHGAAARYLARKLPVALTLDSFVGAMRSFLAQRQRANEKAFYAARLNVVHDWKSWLRHFAITLKGIAGPGAPHLFHFTRRAGWGWEQN